MSLFDLVSRLLIDNLVVGTAGFLETQGRSLRRNTFRLAISLVLLGAGALLLVISMIMVFLGLFLILEAAAGPPGAAFLCAASALPFALLCFLWARKKIT